MRVFVMAAVAATVSVLSPLALHAGPAGAEPTTCGLNLKAPEIETALASVPTLPDTNGWDRNVSSFDPSSNYNPCATLSTVIITVIGATGSSPDLAMMFHKGSYVGVATLKAYAFTSVNAAKTTDDTVALDYKDGREVCTACPGPTTTVRYQWQNDKLVMLDPAPAW